MIPDLVFSEEAKHLTPVPELSKPVPPRTAIIRKTNVVHYKQNRYQVPKGTYLPGREARIVVDEKGERVAFYDAKTGELLAEHIVDIGVGRLVRLPRNAGRFKEHDYSPINTRLLTEIGGFDEAKAYAEKLILKYPRYARDQLKIMYQCVTAYTRDELEKALNYCTERDLISANDLRDTLIFFRQDEPKIVPKPVLLPDKYQAVRAKIRNIADYAKAAGKGGHLEWL
jgi:hypothetical protein